MNTWTQESSILLKYKVLQNPGLNKVSNTPHDSKLDGVDDHFS